MDKEKTKSFCNNSKNNNNDNNFGIKDRMKRCVGKADKEETMN